MVGSLGSGYTSVPRKSEGLLVWEGYSAWKITAHFIYDTLQDISVYAFETACLPESDKGFADLSWAGSYQKLRALNWVNCTNSGVPTKNIRRVER